MGRKASLIQPLQGNLVDAVRAPQEVAGGGQEGGDNYGNRDGCGYARHIQLAEVGGINVDVFLGQSTTIGRDFAGSVDDTEGRRKIPNNITRGSDLEDGGGDP